MRLHLLWNLIFLLNISTHFSQTYTPGFCNFLYERGELTLLELECKRILVNVPEYSDSAHYWLAKRAFLLKKNLESWKELSKIQNLTTVTPKKNYILNRLQFPQVDSSLFWKQVACLYLFQPTINNLDFDNFDEEQLYSRIYNQTLVYYQKPKKKQLLAAGLSIIPGLGKWYVGKPAAAWSNFVICAITGLQAYEGFRFQQWKSPTFYLFGSICLTYYLSGIISSSIHAKIWNLKLQSDFQQAVLLELDYPLYRLLGE